MPDTPTLPGLIPRMLTRVQAAAYLGVSPETFSDEIAAGLWPQGRPRGAKGGKLTWDRHVLDRAADGLAGLSNAPAVPSPEDDAAAALERRLDGQTQRQRDQRRQQKAA